MKVISKPDITAWTYKFTCQTCKSELQADYTDLKYRTQEKWYNGRDIDDGFYAKEDHFYVICPVCTKETEIIPNKQGVNMPYLLQEHVKKGSNESPKKDRHK